jgi:Raf kinase inhibitor-like YbhB/YbcL family protein
MTTHLIARLLRPVRAGVNHTIWHNHAANMAPEAITITSGAFDDGCAIPRRHAGLGVGDNISPPLQWTGVPADTAELVLIIEDPDVPLPRPIVHGLVAGIDPHLRELPEGALTLSEANAAPAVTPGLALQIGFGSFKRRGYAGPRPIPGHGPHRYIFQIFALDRPSGLDCTATLPRALSAIDGKVIARGRLTGTYERARFRRNDAG